MTSSNRPFLAAAAVAWMACAAPGISAADNPALYGKSGYPSKRSGEDFWIKVEANNLVRLALLANRSAVFVSRAVVHDSGGNAVWQTLNAYAGPTGEAECRGDVRSFAVANKVAEDSSSGLRASVRCDVERWLETGVIQSTRVQRTPVERSAVVKR